MSLLSLAKFRFENTSQLEITKIEINDPKICLFLDLCYQVISSLSANEPDQRSLLIRVVGFYRRVASYIADDFNSELMESEASEEFSELLGNLSQYQCTENYLKSLEKSFLLIKEKATNYKKQAIFDLCKESNRDDLQIILRGHKWRTFQLDRDPFIFNEIKTIDFDFIDYSPQVKTITPISPHLLASSLLREVYFSGGCEHLYVFLYKKEKFKLPDTVDFIGSDPSQDSPLLSCNKISEVQYELNEEHIGLSDMTEPDLFTSEVFDGLVSGVKLLLQTEDEISLHTSDHVWVASNGVLLNLLAADLEEGMQLLLRPDTHIEKPEVYLERSEEWRTPLRNILNTILSCSELAREIEHSSGISVSSRMVRSWEEGSVMGPEDKEVFSELIRLLTQRNHLPLEYARERFEFWWEDLCQIRSSQTAKGLQNREVMLNKARSILNGKESELNFDDCEFSEVFVVERFAMNTANSEEHGKSNRRKMRVFQ